MDVEVDEVVVKTAKVFEMFFLHNCEDLLNRHHPETKKALEC